MYFEYTKIIFLVALMASSGFQMWNNYKRETFQNTVVEQLKGKLSANARKIAEMSVELKTSESKVISQAEMIKKTEEILASLGENGEKLAAHLDQTDSVIKSYNRRFSTIKTDITEGFSSITVHTQNTTEVKLEKPPESREGVNAQEFYLCSKFYDADKCPRIDFNWKSKFKNRDEPALKFNSQNIWLSDEGSVKLNLAFKIDVVTIGEGSGLGSGAVKNQAVYVQAGYFDQDKFTAIAEDTLEEGDPNLSKFIHIAEKPVDNSEGVIPMWDRAFYLGVGFLPNKDFEAGLSASASMFNTWEGQLRLGGQALISNEFFGIGPSVSYHYRIDGRYLNFAPNVSYLLSSNSQELTLGLSFQLW